MFLLFNMLSRFVIAFLPRSKCLLISWLKSSSSVIFGTQENKLCHCFHFPPSICHEMMGPDAMILAFSVLSTESVFHSPLSPSSRGSLVPLCLLPLDRVVSPAYLRLFIFLLVILIPTCDSSSLVFHMIYSAYKLNK